MKDPVCGMEVQPESAAGSETHAGQAYYFCGKGCAAKFRAEPEKYVMRPAAPNFVQIGKPASPVVTFKDPVCGMQVNPDSAAGSHAHEGQTYYFCSTGCLHKFRADPAKYLAPRPAPVEHPTAKQYTCPMHPADHPRPARHLPHLRHGTRTHGRRDR